MNQKQSNPKHRVSLDEYEEDYLLPQPMQCSVFQHEYRAVVYDIFLDEEIKQPSYYRKALETFMYAGPNDIIRLHFNTGGGLLTTALSFISAISETQATVVGINEGECHSAGSIILLSCDDIQIKPYSSMMVHSVSYGSAGTSQNVVDHVTFTNMQAEELIRSVYKHFLSPKEIEDILHNREIWLTDKEIEARVEVMFEEREVELSKSLEAFPEENFVIDEDIPEVKPKKGKKK